jgi:transposase
MKTMPQTTKEARYRWIRPVLDKKITINDLSEICPFSERTIKYWLARYRKEGVNGLENRSRRPKTQPNETPIRTKERIIELRKKTGLCAKKLAWKLEKEGIKIHYNTVHKIIKQEGLTRRYRTKKIKYKYVKLPLRPGELIEIDVKYVPMKVKGDRLYQFTAIDCSSRWRHLKVYPEQTTQNSLRFLKEVINKAPFRIRSVKTDNHSIFTNRYTGYLKSKDPFNPRLHAFDLLCQRMNIIHYLIDPGKPAQNGKVERSHRTDSEQFYAKVNLNSFNELEQKIKLWNMKYNNLEHCALKGLSPNEFLRSRVQNVCV